MLCEAYTEDKVPDAKGNKETRIVMRFHPRLAPIKAAIFPLVNKDGMPEKAKKLYRELKPHFNVFYDDEGRGRPALPPAGRGRHAVLHHHRRRHDEGRHGDDPRPRHAEAGAGADVARCERVIEKALAPGSGR